jgi:hypothetical protein
MADFTLRQVKQNVCEQGSTLGRINWRSYLWKQILQHRNSSSFNSAPPESAIFQPLRAIVLKIK